MSKHTEGPWLREGNTVYALMHFRWFKGVEQFKNRFWASVYKDKDVSEEEREANARLIAAAPELLEALNEAKQQITALCSAGDVPDSVNAAISKAEGEAS